MFAGSIINCHWFKTNFLLVQPTSFHGKVTYQFLFSSGVKCPCLLVNWFGRLDQTPFFLGFTTIFLLRSPIFDACPTLSQLVPGEMSKFADATLLPKLGTSGEAPSNCQLPAPVTRKKSGCVEPIDWGLSHSSLKSTLCVGGNKGKVYHFQMSEFFWVCQILGWPEQFMINNLFSCLQDIQS